MNRLLKAVALVCVLATSSLIAQVQLGKGVQIGFGSGGTGNPGGAASAAQFNCAVFCGSKATFDASGNFTSLSNDGLRNAFLNQTTPTSNNGIRNSLQTPGNIVVAGPNYPPVEGTFSGNSTCLPGDTNWRDAIGCPPPFANNTLMLDYRTPGWGSYAYNTSTGTIGGFWQVDRWVSNQQTQSTGGGVNVVPYARDFEMFGSGKNGFENGGPDSFEPFAWNFENYRRGIVSVMNIEQQDGSIGDNHLYQNSINNNRGTSAGADEGFNIFRNQIQQNLTPMVATANSTLAAGATLIPGTLISPVPFVGDGTFYIDATTGGSTFHVTGLTDPSPTVAGTFTVDATLTPDNIGQTTAPINTPKQYYGATTNETVTVTGLTSPIVTTSTVCYADHAYLESARVVSVGSLSGGTQTITVAIRYVHLAGAYITQGPNSCNAIEMRANQITGTFPGRHLYRVIGASDSHHLLYSRIIAGNWGGPSGYFSTNIIAAAGATITRNGSNVASVSVSDSNRNLDRDLIIVSGCANSTFNGLFPLASNDGSTVTWPNTGSATTTTCTNAIEIQSELNGFSVREAQLFPAAEIVNPLDPVTFANNQNITVEPNTNLQVTAGDHMENHVYSDVQMGTDHTLYDFRTQTSPSIPNVIHNDQFNGLIPEGFVYQRVALQEQPHDFIGLGGTKPILANLFQMGNNITPFLNLWDLLPPPRGHIFSINGCLYGCADTRSTFSIFDIPTNNGNYSESIHQDTGIMNIVSGNLGGNTTLRVQPEGINVIAGGSTSTVFAVVPAGVISTANGGAGTSSSIDQSSSAFATTINGTLGAVSHVTQTVAGWSSDVPITVPSCTGCGVGGGFITALTTTGSSGPATVSGSTLNIPVYSGGGGNTTSTALTTNTIPKANGANSIIDSGLTDDGTKLTYTGSGTANGLQIPEGTAIAGVGASDNLWADSATHRWMQNPNNIGALMIPGVGTAAAPASPTLFGANGVDILGAAQIFYSQPGDTIASIEAECSSLCTYVVTLPQTFTLGANHALSSNVQVSFKSGGKWTVNGAFTLTIPGNVDGTLNQHFAGTSVIAGLSGAVPVEWFGAVGFNSKAGAGGGPDYTVQIQKALDSLTGGGWVQLQLLCYQASSGLTITTSSIGIHGLQGRDSFPTGPHASCLVSNSATANMLTVQGLSGTYILWNTFKDFSLERLVQPTGTVPTQSVGMYVQYAGGVVIDTVTSNDNFDGFYFNGAPGFSAGRFANVSCANGLTGVNSYTSGMTINCFDIDSSNGVAMNSPYFLNGGGGVFNTAVSATSASYYVHGTAINDLNIYSPESSSQSYGIKIVYTGSGGLDTDADIHVNNPTFDNCSISCVYVSGLPNAGGSGVSVDSGYFASNASSKIVDIESSYGVAITNNQIYINGSSAIGIYANASSNLTLSMNKLQALVTGTGFQLNGTIASIVNGNSLLAVPTQTLTSGIGLTSSSTGNTLVGNNVSGVVTTGYSFDGSSLTNDVTANTCSGTVTTCTSGLLVPVGIVTATNAASTLAVNPVGGTNGTIDFGANFGAPAIELFHGGGSIFGFGIQGGELQSFILSGHFSWNTGGYEPSGTSEVMRLTDTADLTVGHSVTTTLFHETLTTPASSSATCSAGDFTDDANFHYVCTATNTWKRAALVTF